MSLAYQFFNALEAAGEDMESVIGLRQFYLDNHTIRHYSDEGLEIIFFKDHSILRADRISKCQANVTPIQPEDALDFINDLDLEIKQRMQNEDTTTAAR